MNSDKLELSASESFELKNSEQDINLNLSNATTITTGSVKGKVYDTTLLTGNVVSGATVKVFKSDGTPYNHTVTNGDGSYTIGSLPLGVYLISAVKDGYILSVGLTLPISTIIPVTMNLVITPNAKMSKNVIYGKIKDFNTGAYLVGAEILLYQGTNENGNLKATTTSIKDGEFIIENIDNGTYTLSYEKDGYNSEEVSNVELSDKQKFNGDMSLKSSVGNIGSTVSGQVKTISGIVVPNAFVGLYRINGINEILTANTYTNTNGRYMFGSVTNGTYIVKSKKSEII